MNILKEIWTDKLSDYKVMDIIAKIWITVLLFMFLLGFIMVMYGIISGEADIQNATTRNLRRLISRQYLRRYTGKTVSQIGRFRS
jgi:ABC-type Fe3+ transport system permease subunit